MNDAGRSLTDELKALESSFATDLGAISTDASDAAQQLLLLKSVYLGPKGKLTAVLRGLGKLTAEERPAAGRESNRARQAIEAGLDRAVSEAEAKKKQRELTSGRLDMTLPGRRPHLGSIHPVHRVIREAVGIFERMGFEVATGPEVELDWFNFGALNFPADHPARDMQDTFFVKAPDARANGEVLLRTHTSPVQIRAMSARGAPIRIVSPGRVYRCDSDATHSPMFHQIEGLWVDEGVSFAHLKGVLMSFVNAFFGERRSRFRPSFFPFVEPGAEMDMECALCRGAGCRVCKGTGFIEILGAGMVHPNVLRAANIDPERYTGFAFGMGMDRVAMSRYGIDDLKHLFQGDVRFLGQL
ncbi:MAG: phenylalanine--tRNA ligase subunit alpha [Deltaproteobacteria bacterium]|nr:phenylalanine--tRNA ligase subunit alpha [Deltaproteobacteria bacterium]